MSLINNKYVRIGVCLVFLITLSITSVYLGWSINEKTNQEIILLKDHELLSMNRSFELFKQHTEIETESLKQTHSEQIKQLNSQIQRSGFIDYAPETQKIKEFLRKDRTSRMNYDEFSFNCVDFTQMMINNLFEQNIRACYTYIEFNNGAHAVVAINTSDNGVIYVEPQDDYIIYSMEVGDDYCKLANWGCNWKIIKKVSCFD